MAHFIDRRLNPQHKSAVNRQRFLKRYKSYVREAVRKAIDERSLDDMNRGEKVSIPTKDTAEPNFGHARGGNRSIVHPGNKEFSTGDRIERPRQSGGGSGKQGSPDGEGLDPFEFELTREEFMEIMFEDLELPNLVKRQLAGTTQFHRIHGGFTTDGTPSSMHVVRTFRSATARRIAMTGKLRAALAREESLLEQTPAGAIEKRALLEESIESLRARIRKVPFLDDNDLRYRRVNLHPKPTARAVMFCLMDVSGSMDQRTKQLAKRFFLLLYLFLQRNYERVEIVFIRYHTRADEVDEEQFFYSRETGGTVASTALDLMRTIIRDRYSPSEWNIYGSQASDGDNWGDDTPSCVKLLREHILPASQFFSYVEINGGGGQDLWHQYADLVEEFAGIFAQRQISDEKDVYPALRDLFQKRTKV